MKSTIFFIFFFAVCYGQEFDKTVTTFIDNNELEKATKRLQKLEIDSIDYWFLSGKIQRKRGDYQVAKKYLNKILANDSTYFLAYDELGVICAISGKYEESIEQFQTGLKYKDSSSIIMGHLGATYYLMNKYNLAIQYLNHAYKKEPTNDYILYNLGLCYLAKKQYEKASDYFSKSLAIRKKDYKAHYDRGVAYYNSGNAKLALKDFKKAEKYNGTENKYEKIPGKDIENYISKSKAKIRALRLK
jgi:tetratricopeptide (TPR) repeat protein